MAAIVTAGDVLARTGATVTDAQILQAQGIVELFTGSDLTRADWLNVFFPWPRDQRKVRLAIAYQAAFIAAHPDVFTSADVKTSMADGASQTGTEMWAQLAPLARVSLRKLTKNRSRSRHVHHPAGSLAGTRTGPHMPGSIQSWDGPNLDGVGVPFYDGTQEVPEWTDVMDNWTPLQ